LRTKGGVVATDNPIASQVGADVLASGGNAVDAAVAAAFALGVVNPTSSGIGGGGFAVVYIAAEKKLYVIDFREVAPAALRPESFERDGKLDVSLSRRGGLAVGVPGEVAGLELLSQRFGRRSFRRAVAPAVRLASQGFAVGWFLARAAALTAVLAKRDTALHDLLYRDGRVIEAGLTITRPDLARTLALIGRRGRAGFYTGPVAHALVEAVANAGGVITAEDLAAYRAVERQPLEGRWGRYRVVTMPLPSSGGIVLLESLGILQYAGAGKDASQDSMPLAHLGGFGPGSSAALHLIVEVLKHAFADRARFLGDEAASADLATRLLDPARLRRIASRIKRNSVLPHGRYGDKKLGKPRPAAGSDGGTSHLCAIDRDGNAVALTTTVNGYFGAKLVVPTTGIVLNNQIDDFTLRAGTPNQFGLVQSAFNLVGPGKRPLSSMSPTLVLEGDRVVACLGGSGGPHIISNTLQVLLNAFVFGMDAREAVSAPRVHDQWTPDQLIAEDEIPRDVITSLERKGHKVLQRSWRDSPTAVQLVLVRDDGTREAASDPRKGGAPAAAP